MKIIKNIRDFIGELDTPDRYLLLSGVLLFVSLAVIFIFTLPSLSKLSNLSAAVNIEKGNLNYVTKYAKRINSLRAQALMAVPQVKSKKTGYIKSVYSMLNYFKIGKNNIEKLTGSYSKKKHQTKTGLKGQNSGHENEDVSIALRGLTLNELIDTVYGLSTSGYRVKFLSIKVHKNFDDKKLLNLDIAIKRKRAVSNLTKINNKKNDNKK